MPNLTKRQEHTLFVAAQHEPATVREVAGGS